MVTTLHPTQPESQPESGAAFIDSVQAMHVQREIPIFSALPAPALVPEDVVRAWGSYRDAVVWCWDHQRHFVGVHERARQALFANHAGLHAPHASRCLKTDSKAPMLLPDRCINALETFTGWRGVRQYQLRDADLTAMEFVIAARRAA